MPKFIPLVLGLTSLMAVSAVSFASDSALIPTTQIKHAPTDWPGWRGPQGSGIASADQLPPLKWSKTENDVWKAAIPGRGHSSPTVVGDRVLIATAEEDREVQSVQDTGVATCWKSDTGEELWKERLGGTFTASLVLVGDNLFATNEPGQTFIFKARPEKFERVAENQLGDEVYATPAICGGRIYMRVVEKAGGQRQEMLYCLGRE